MRRGGGSFGGGRSFGGGGFRRSGGSRGSSISMGRSRISSSSHRNHRRSSHYGSNYHGHYYGHRRRYYGGYYYGGAYYDDGYYDGGVYYGRRRRRYYGRRESSGLLLFFLFIVGLILIAIIASAFGGSQTVSNDLEAGEGILIGDSDYSLASMTVGSGSVDTYFFDNQPSVIAVLDYSNQFNDEQLQGFNYLEYSDVYTEGAELEVQWSATSAVSFFIVIGDSDHTDWVAGSNTEVYSSGLQTSTATWSVSSSERVYFIFENPTGSDLSYDVTITVHTPVYDLTPATSSESGNFADKSIDSNYVLVVNVGNDDASFNLRLENTFGFGQIFGVLLVVLIIGLYFLSKRIGPGPYVVVPGGGPGQQAGSSTQTQNVTQSPTQTQTVTQSPSITINVNSPGQAGTSVKSSKSSKSKGMDAAPAKSAEPQFIQRPTPKYCPTCGEAVLTGSAFCVECGASIKH